MNVMALEPYYGGSHRAFLDAWIARSRHAWTLLSLPATKWKWRMRHAPYTMAGEVVRAGAGSRWDLLFASDMMNLAEFRGLAPEPVRSLPALLYFHENQITYPVEYEQERDHHFGFSNMSSALCAERVWFNSDFHLRSFLSGLQALLRRMPDHRSPEVVDRIRKKSRVRAPGIDLFPPRAPRAAGPMRILWAARWEHDKRPDVFFNALSHLASEGIDFRLAVIGGGNAAPIAPAMEEGRLKFADRILRWGYLASKEDYRAALLEADVVVSTAEHDFFGISVAEAVAAGAYPMLPYRLAYPEILQEAGEEARRRFFYRGDERELARRLAHLARRLAAGDLWQGDPDRARRAVERFAWSRLAPQYDEELVEIAADGGARNRDPA